MKWCRELYDYIIVGAGLQGGLLTLAINHHQPDATILLIDQGTEVGGNHTWSFHAADVPATAHCWLDALVTSQWSDYLVRFPGFERRVNLPYSSIDSRHFGRIVSQVFQICQLEPSAIQSTGGLQTLPAISGRVKAKRSVTELLSAGTGSSVWRSQADLRSKLLLGTEVDHVSRESVCTPESEFDGKVVIDCRGPDRAEPHSIGHCGFQKFHGFEIELERAWPESYPVVMDGCVNQRDGFRFMYTLPFNSHRVLVEDTQFSDSRELDRAMCLRNVTAFIEKRTNSRWRIIREESGCLPMPWTQALMPSAHNSIKGGYAGGWFHAATGYSFPLAVRFAEAVATTPADRVDNSVRRLVDQHQSQAKQARFLNRLLFRMVRPDRRYEIFRRFYRVLPEESISRFFAHSFTGRDLSRIIVGRPPSRLSPLRFIHSLVHER